MKDLALVRKVPRITVKNLVSDAKVLYNEETQEFMEGFRWGTTFIAMRDSMLMQSVVQCETIQSVDCAGEQCHFNPAWSPCLTFVHHDDGFGARFPDLPHMNNSKFNCPHDLRIVWVMFGVITSDPVIYRSVVQSLETVDQWQGWFLQCCSEKVNGFIHRRSSKNNPFKKLEMGLPARFLQWNPFERLAQFVMQRLRLSAPYEYTPLHLIRLFEDVDNVTVVDWEFCQKHNGEIDITEVLQEESNEIVIFVRDVFSNSSIRFPSSVGSWSIQGLLSTFPATTNNSFHGKNVCRHGGTIANKFWVRSHYPTAGLRKHNSHKAIDGNLGEGFECANTWDCVIYKNQNHETNIVPRIKYMELSLIHISEPTRPY